jgi:hypothetical protein
MAITYSPSSQPPSPRSGSTEPYSPIPSPDRFVASPSGTLRRVKRVELAEYKCVACDAVQLQHVIFDDQKLMSCDYCFGCLVFVRLIGDDDDSDKESDVKK